MKPILLTAAAALMFSTAVYADDPAPTSPPLPTHVDTAVVGSSVTGQAGDARAPTLDNNHDFVAGAPELLKVTKRLNLSPKQETQLHAVIEKSDAGAAMLIGREHDVKQMIAATTPADPVYAKLISEQAAGEGRWTENRDNLQRDVLGILTPAQRTRFEQLQATQ